MSSLLIALILLYNLALCVFVVQVVRYLIGAGPYRRRTLLLLGLTAAVLVLIPLLTTGPVATIAHWDTRPPLALSVGIVLVGSGVCVVQHRRAHAAQKAACDPDAPSDAD